MQPNQNFIYLDHAAATPIDPAVQAAMEPYFSSDFYNPSATYLPAQHVRDMLETARTQVAIILGIKPAEFVFTAGGSEANNLAIHGLMSLFPEGNIVTTGIEHDSILAPIARHNSKIAPVKPDGTVDIDQLVSLIDDKTVIVSVMYANNEIGTIQPLRDIAQRIQKVKQLRKNNLPLYFHSDACQAANTLDLHVSRLGVDMLTLNGGKIYGPKQSGGLYVRAGIELRPLIDGGGQERGLRSGTENVAGAVGFSTALQVAQSKRETEHQRLTDLQTLWFTELGEQLPEALVNGSVKNRLSNNIHITLPGTDNERVLLKLEAHGILAAAGSACSASNEEASHVLKAMGLSDDYARSSLRFSMGRSTNAAQIEQTIKVLAAIVKK